jgi:glycosyltransferase involved in cell wall biosynthesis
VDLARFSPGTGPREYDLLAGAFAPYKRADLALEACRRLGRRLLVVGSGQERARLEAIAGPDVEFRGWVGEDELADLYRGARTLLFPGEEDFGIVPVEAMAHGCPVVAYGVGGACETVAAGVTGVLFGEQTVEALCEAMLAGERTTFDPAAMHAHAQQFGKVRFLREMGELLSHRGASGPKGMIT